MFLFEIFLDNKVFRYYNRSWPFLSVITLFEVCFRKGEENNKDITQYSPNVMVVLRKNIQPRVSRARKKIGCEIIVPVRA